MHLNRSDIRIGLPWVTSWADAQQEALIVARRVRDLFASHFSQNSARVEASLRLEECKLYGTLSADDFQASVSTMPQQGAPASPPSVFSIVVTCEASVPSVSKAINRAQGADYRVRLLCGALVAAVLVVAVAAVALLTGWIVLSTWYIVGVIVLSGSIGTPITSFLVNRAKRRSIATAAQNAATMRLVEDWSVFTEALNRHLPRPGQLGRERDLIGHGSTGGSPSRAANTAGFPGGRTTR